MNRIEALNYINNKPFLWGKSTPPFGWEWAEIHNYLNSGKVKLVLTSIHDMTNEITYRDYVKWSHTYSTPTPKHINCKIRYDQFVNVTAPIAPLSKPDRLEPCGQSFGELMNDLKGSK